MPRRLPHDHDEMRARAIAAARAAISEGGLAALSARQIAGELGCSVGSLYNLFVDLDDLVLHVAASVVADMRAALFDEPLPADPGAALRTLARRYLAHARAAGRLFATIFEHEPRHDRPTPAWHLAGIEEIFAAVAAVAGRAAGEGVERRDVEALWAAVHGVAALAVRDKLAFVARSDAETLVDTIVARFLAA
ncbi:MAG: WHG domain-containing protein [Hyphomicrobiales bacterium]|nr:WHG domain-containing protein [Hyphomicrobiales bacterium]